VIQCKTAVIILSVVGLLHTTLIAADRTAQISADQMRYREETHHMELEDKVSIKSEDIEINADHLSVDTETNIATGTGNITVRRGDDEFKTDRVRLDLDHQTAELHHIHVQIQPPGNPNSIYVKVDEIKDEPEIKSGASATLTSCALPEPHYYVWSQYFSYKPNEYILTYNTWIWSPIMGIPFVLWTPVYYYEIGKRSLIWNIPTIGRREVPGWGWFIQNTIDYDELNGRSSSVFVDWFENKGVGYGARHQYEWEKLTGSVYYYTLTEQDTGNLTQKKAWDGTYTEGPFTLSGGIESVAGERLSSSGKDVHESKQWAFNYADVGETIAIEYSDKQDFLQNTAGNRLSARYGFNGQNVLRFSESEDIYRTFKSSVSDIRAGATLQLPEQYTLRTDSVFDRDFQSNISDDRLKLNTEITKPLAPNIKASLVMDYSWDLDGDTVTRDIASGRNNFLFAVPKLTITDNEPAFPIPFSQELTIARFQEYNYISSQRALRIYPEVGQFSLEPNTILYKINSTSVFQDLPLSGNITNAVGYQQQLFKNPDRGWTDSDAGYAISFSESINNYLFGLLKTSFAYTNRFAPNTNNSPFITLDLTREIRNDISGSLLFFIADERKYYWNNTSQYSWLSRKWDLYSTEVGFKPSEMFAATIQTGKKLNPDPGEISTRYQPLVINMEGGPTKNLYFRYDISLDLNDLIDRHLQTVLQSSFTSSFVIDANTDYQWEVRSTMRYNPRNQTGSFDLSRYELQTLSIVKQEHCRSYQFGYNSLSNEFTFQITINAFPDDKITIRKTRDQFKLQGVLDDPTQERL
jgi:lipopolysaccharide export system protein LptA